MAALTSNSANRVPWLVEPAAATILRFSDCAILLTAGVLTYQALSAADTATWPPLQEPELLLLIVGILVTPHAYNLCHLYGPRPLTAFHAWPLIQAQLIVAGCLGAFVVFLDTEPVRFAWWLCYWQLLTFAGVFYLRRGLRTIVRRWPSTARLTRNVVIVGMPALAKKLAGQFSTAGDPAVRLIGLFHDPQYPPSPGCPFPVLGGSEDLVAFARTTPIDEVIVALPWHAEDRLAEWMRVLRNIPCDVLLSPPEMGGVTPKCAIENLAGMTLLKVAERPLAGAGYVAKAIEDRVLGGLLVVVLSPLMLAIALLIQLDSPGPI
ncbi:MAG TPA: hypothetical protein VE175_13645, partial [Woeseiaceae bacterium]|nr:hypothetical protein [Woeseiaceae bacterium]